MPFREVSKLEQRHEFVRLVVSEGTSISALCKRFGISRETGYYWLRRFQEEGEGGLVERSRAPHSSPLKVSRDIEEAVLAVRQEHPTWGGRKIRHKLEEAGHATVPSPSTITTILKRHGQLRDPVRGHHAYVRFEHEAPNQLWQMDFKGHFPTGEGRCHPLTLLDDHSRFALCLKACKNEDGPTVQESLTEVFRHYGLPERITMDNGSPWGCDTAPYHTALTLWLVRLGIGVSHSRPYHPQTQGKLERFHRTLKAELLAYESLKNLEHAQDRFDRWRYMYNFERPHEALGMAAPIARYQPSRRDYPEHLPPIEYGPSDHVRKVQGKGEISFKNRYFVVGRAFRGLPVALRATLDPEVWEVYFCNQRIAEVDLREGSD